MDILNDKKVFEDIPPKTNNPLAFEKNLNDTKESNAHIHTFNQSLFNTADNIPSSYHQLLDLDQHGPPIFYRFDNDDTIIIEFEIYGAIMNKNHIESISPKVNTLAYCWE